MTDPAPAGSGTKARLEDSAQLAVFSLERHSGSLLLLLTPSLLLDELLFQFSSKALCIAPLKLKGLSLISES